MKILLDTKVLIAAFISHGSCADLVERALTEHVVVTSRFILGEFKDKMIRKFKVSPARVYDILRHFKDRMLIVKPAVLSKSVCRDSDDDQILGTAITGACDCIITGDKDLLVLKKYQGIPIVSPKQFWNQYGASF